MGKRGGEEEKGRLDTKPFSNSNHAAWGWKAPVKASVSSVSLPFSLPSFPFSPETPDTQARLTPHSNSALTNSLAGGSGERGGGSRITS